MTDVWRRREVAWGQYGEKLAETNSDLTSPREIRERKCSRKILVPRGQTLPAAASSRDGPFPYRSTVAKGPFQAHLIGVPSVTKHLFERAVVVSSNLAILNGGVPDAVVVSSNLAILNGGDPEVLLQALVLGPSISLVKIMQSGAPPTGLNAVPVDPEQSLPRSFPGGLAAVGGAASIFEGLMLATEEERSLLRKLREYRFI